MRYSISTRAAVVIVMLALTACAGGQTPATTAAANQGVKPVNSFVILFRQGPFDLNPERQKQRFEETRVWALRHREAGIKLDPRILAEQAHRAGPTQPDAPAADPAWAVTAAVFVEAPDFEQAARVADEHPARRYGASVEVRPWSPPPAPPPTADATTFPVQHISISIDRPAEQVYHFAVNPENLPRWAAGLSTGIEKVGDDWIADSPMGKVKVKFAEANKLGVLDHDVTLPSGEVVPNPMRVVPNGRGCEMTFTLFRRAGVSDEAFRDDAARVEEDLRQLKRLLEH